MPLNVKDAMNSGANRALGFNYIRKIARNPLLTAMAIVCIMVVVVMFNFHDTIGDESVYVMALRSGFWAGIFIVGILFLHDHVLISEVSNDKFAKDTADLFDMPKGGYSPNLLDPTFYAPQPVQQFPQPPPITTDPFASTTSILKPSAT